MKIFIKKGSKSYGIKIPLGAVKLIPAGTLNRAVSNCCEDLPAAEIDFKEIKKAIHLLKEYKGLNIVEVKNPNGDEVIIRI